MNTSYSSSSTPADGAAAVMKLAAMVHLLEGSESPKYQRLIRRAEALQATSHHGGSSSGSFLSSSAAHQSSPSRIGNNSSYYSPGSGNTNNNSNISKSLMNQSSIVNSSFTSSNMNNNNNNNNNSTNGGGGGGTLATEGATSMATLAGAHAARGDFLEASRLQSRAIDFEIGQCRRGIREWKRAMDRTDRAMEVSRFPEEPLLVKRDDLNNSYGDEMTPLCPPRLRGQLAVIADLFECLGDYQESANNTLDCSASRRKARTLRSAITF